MRMTIEVESRHEGDAIKSGLEDSEARAYLVAVGILRQLPDDQARSRVLRCTEILLGANGTPRVSPLRMHDGSAVSSPD